MLHKQNRVTSKFQFNVIKKYGTKHNFDFFNAIVLTARNYEGPAKIGFVVPNAITKSAAKRNRAKRQLREAFRLKIKQIPDNLWIAVYAKNAILERTYEEISDQVDRFIQKISVAK